MERSEALKLLRPTKYEPSLTETLRPTFEKDVIIVIDIKANDFTLFPVEAHLRKIIVDNFKVITSIHELKHFLGDNS